MLTHNTAHATIVAAQQCRNWRVIAYPNATSSNGGQLLLDQPPTAANRPHNQPSPKAQLSLNAERLASRQQGPTKTLAMQPVRCFSGIIDDHGGQFGVTAPLGEALHISHKMALRVRGQVNSGGLFVRQITQ